MISYKKIRKKVLKKYGFIIRAVSSRLGILAVFAGVALTVAVITLSSVKVLAVNVDGEHIVIRTLNNDVYQTMNESGIEIAPNDIVDMSFNGSNVDISITRTFPVTLLVDGVNNYQWVSGGTVGDLLEQNKIYLSGEDKINVEKDVPLSSGLKIEVTRISTKQYDEYVSIPYSTKIEKIYFGSSIGKMPKNVKGVEGVRKITKVDTVVNGVVTESKTISNVIEKQPVTEIKYEAVKGPTKIVAGKELKYSKVYTMSATAYTTVPGKTGIYTATGVKVSKGCIAINPKIVKYLSLGDKLYIETADGSYVYGYGTINDTGGMKGANDIDLFFPSLADCNLWGRRTVKVYVLEE